MIPIDITETKQVPPRNTRIDIRTSRWHDMKYLVHRHLLTH